MMAKIAKFENLMAKSATIVKAKLAVNDLNRHHYQNYNLTLAQHPSETTQRFMLRVLAFALNASDTLSFTKGLCADDEPELWQKNLSDEIQLWIELGLPDEKRIKKACTQAKQAILYAYGENNQQIWWQKMQSSAAKFNNLQIVSIAYTQSQALANLFARNLDLTFTIEDNQVWVSSEQENCEINLTNLNSG